jgi:hypothetical protein
MKIQLAVIDVQGERPDAYRLYLRECFILTSQHFSKFL